VVKIVFLIFSSHVILANGIKLLPKELQYKSKEQIQDMLKSTADSISLKSSAIEKSVYRRKRSVFVPDAKAEKIRIKKFERINGFVDGHIISNNSSSEEVVVYLSGSSKIPNGAYLTCYSSNLVQKYNYRVKLDCNTLVTDENEYSVEVSIKDENGVDGLVADKVFDGESEKLFGAVVSSLTNSVLEGTKSKEKTILGEINSNNVGNSYVTALQAGVSAGNEKILSHTQAASVILVVYSRRKVIVNFRKGFTYEGI